MSPVNHSVKDTEAIGKRLMEARLRKGLSQRELARRTPLTAAYISRLETGDRTASYDALRFFAGPLGVSPEWLETGTERPGPGDEALALWFTPAAIREHLESVGVPREVSEWLDEADEDDLREVGATALAGDLVKAARYAACVRAIELAAVAPRGAS